MGELKNEADLFKTPAKGVFVRSPPHVEFEEDEERLRIEDDAEKHDKMEDLVQMLQVPDSFSPENYEEGYKQITSVIILLISYAASKSSLASFKHEVDDLSKQQASTIAKIVELMSLIGVRPKRQEFTKMCTRNCFES